MFLFCENLIGNATFSNWDTSKVTNMNRSFANSAQFNQSLDSWDVSNLTTMKSIFADATSFNQSLANWNLVSLVNAESAFGDTAIDCENYSKTITGWADNPHTANNVSLVLISPMQYASNITNKRSILINKGWSITRDILESCFLSTSEIKTREKPSIYSNPASDYIYVKNLKNTTNYKIYDTSGRLLKEGKVVSKMVDVSFLSKGNYILQLITDKTTLNFKFIKN